VKLSFYYSNAASVQSQIKPQKESLLGSDNLRDGEVEIMQNNKNKSQPGFTFFRILC